MLDIKLIAKKEKLEDCEIELTETIKQTLPTKFKDVLDKKKYLETSITKFQLELGEINELIDRITLEINKTDETKEEPITKESEPV